MRIQNLTKYKFGIVSIAATALLSIASCKKLDEKVYGSDTSANFYSNSDQVLSGYVMPYSFMQTMIYSVHFALAEFPTDEAVATVKNGNGYENGTWIRFHQHTWTSREDFIKYEWSNLFQGIGYCNAFIDAIEGKSFNFTLPLSKERMISEAKMMRALYYYWAMDEFGGVPVVEHVGEKSPATTTRAEVFSFIEKEIKANIPNLVEKGDDKWYGHFTKTAAYALLAKLYLNAEVFSGTARWDDCITAANEVINSGKYSLAANWSDPFLIDNEGSTENIFVVPFDQNYAPGFNGAQQQLPGALKDKYGFTDYPWGKIVTQESFFNLYNANDKRINQWLVGPQFYDNGDIVWGWYDQDGQQLVIDPKIDKLNNPTGGYGQGVRNVKYQVIQPGASGPTSSNMNNDLVVLRLADIMMAKAEAIMRKAGGAANGEAVTLVNNVRARSFDSGAAGSVYTTATLTLNELLNERGREFAYEMKRREDMIRFGKFEDASWEKPADANKNKELYPIPFDIVTANPALKQNPGY
ncbi:RagB/SusD family nutrient uptake outer membrane protein [Mucilaginibacter conchicola]|uniref:RagB/SusD family nutrient uptake outer membrane protein n=1 Tax=Mucilaginibacter conchicola TaxID=2303333 RepID=A0A372NVU8_9SPHI|nr:RagB/SusD family nutrient uptake outer membrane protein [Mucilaginibacter conchicola]RFZ93991.1 RagB/SusD family nutrient uptake outer membrane protein [Mucilaginibacter conchicola]